MCASYDGSGNWGSGGGSGGGWERRRGGGGRGRGRKGWRGAGRGDRREEYHEGDGFHDRRGRGGHRHGGVRDHSPRGSRGRGGPPAGLKGKDIGMYYAMKSRKKMVETEKRNRPNVQMDVEKEKHLTSLLATIRNADKAVTIPEQPSQSYRHVSDDDSEVAHTTSSASNNEYDSWEERTENTHDSDSKSDGPDRIRGDRTFEPTGWQPTEASTSGEGQPRPVTRPFTAPTSLKPLNLRSDSEGHDDSDFSESDDNRQFRAFSAIPGGANISSDEGQSGDMQQEMEQDGEEDTEELAQACSELLEYSRDTMSDFMVEYHNHKSSSYMDPVEGKLYSGLKQKSMLDSKYKEELLAKQNDPAFKEMNTFREKLPSYKIKNQVLQLVKSNQVSVISGETGCGKTTQVAQFLLDDCIMNGDGSRCHIICTQPRRISAISVAERVAQERAERCGQSSVGYQIRLEHKFPRETGSILYCTTGIMLKRMATDPVLSSISHVILDEIHERDLQSDFLMIILKDLIKKRTDLKVILMSATLNAEMFSQYFYNCPTLNIPGYTFPVKEYELENVLEMTRYRSQSHEYKPRKRIHGAAKREKENERMKFESWLSKVKHHYSRDTADYLSHMDPEKVDEDLICHVIDFIAREKPEGAILVFVPGWEQIKNIHNQLENHPLTKNNRMKVIPLHSQMPTVNQKEIFNRPPPGVRKVVVATNIAETSITIDDVVYVIDCGKIKMKNFDAENNLGTLQIEWVSRANAKQRRGRAGRVQPGECYHLYTTHHEGKFADYQLPEILRTRLEELCLMIKLLKLGKIEPFVRKAMQPPSMKALQHSIETLIQLNALDQHEELTPLGFHLAKMPVDPHTGKMLLFAAMFSCLDPILTIAASLSFKDAFYIPLGKEKIADMRRKHLSDGSKSDHIMLANAFGGWERANASGKSSRYCWDNFLSESTLRLLKNMRGQFATLLYDMKFIDKPDPKCPSANINSKNDKAVKAVICAGLYPNVAKIKKLTRDPILFTNTERSVRLHPKSINSSEYNFDSPWVVYHLKMKTTKIYLYDCSLVSPYPLLFFGGGITVRKEDGRVCVVVDDWISFWSTQNIASLVMELRSELDRLLEYKITHPSSTNWDEKEKEGALMRAILDLITTEEVVVKNRQGRDWKQSQKYSNW